MTNKAKIEAKLRKDGYVDNFWCIDNRITTRLGAVVHVLREEGWAFDEERGGYLPGTKNWRYYLVDAPKAPEPEPPKPKEPLGRTIVLPDGTRVFALSRPLPPAQDGRARKVAQRKGPFGFSSKEAYMAHFHALAREYGL